MKILVFGGAGFIGCVLVEKLLEDRNNEVYVIDNFRKGIDPIVSYMPNNRLDIRHGDIRNIHQIGKQIREIQPDVIVLASGIVGLDDCNNNEKMTVDVNVHGWRNVADAALGYPIIGLSTGSVYGKIENGICTEETPTNPCSLYGETKLEGEKPILDVGGIIYRYATAGGVSRNPRLNLLPNQLTKEAVAEKKLSVFQPDVKRTFIDIRDFANSIIFAINNCHHVSGMRGQIYNVGDESNNWSKREVVEYIKSKTNCSVDYNDDREDADQRNYFCDYSKIRSTGFKCEISVEEMLDDLIAYYANEFYSDFLYMNLTSDM